MKQAILLLSAFFIILSCTKTNEELSITTIENEDTISESSSLTSKDPRRNDSAVPTGACGSVVNPQAHIQFNGNHFPYFVGFDKSGHWNECTPAKVNYTVGEQVIQLQQDGSLDVNPQDGEIVFANNLNRQLTITGLDLDDTPFHALTYSWAVYKKGELLNEIKTNQGRIDVSQDQDGDNYLIRYRVEDEKGAVSYFDTHLEVTLVDPFSDGVVAWYPFNGSVHDQSGNNNYTQNAGAILSQDRHGQEDSAYYFSGDGCDTRIDGLINTPTISDHSSFSFSVWYRHNDLGCIGPRLLEFWPGDEFPGKFVIQLGYKNGTYQPSVEYINIDHNKLSISWDLQPQEWTHLVYTIDEHSYKLYQNGQLLTTYESSPDIHPGPIVLAEDVAFGRMNHPAWDAIDGSLDDIGLWDRVLSEQEVQWLYNN